MNPRLTPRRVGRALRRRMRDRLGTHPRVTVLVLVPEGSGSPDACVASVRASVDVVADAVVVPQQAALADVLAEVSTDLVAFASADDEVPADGLARLAAGLTEAVDLVAGRRRALRAGRDLGTPPPGSAVDLVLGGKLVRRAFLAEVAPPYDGAERQALTVAKLVAAARGVAVVDEVVLVEHDRDVALPIHEQRRFRTDLVTARLDALRDVLLEVLEPDDRHGWREQALVHLLPALCRDAVGGGPPFHAVVQAWALELLAGRVRNDTVPVEARIAAWVAAHGTYDDLALTEDHLAANPHGLPVAEGVVPAPRGPQPRRARGLPADRGRGPSLAQPDPRPAPAPGRARAGQGRRIRPHRVRRRPAERDDRRRGQPGHATCRSTAGTTPAPTSGPLGRGRTAATAASRARSCCRLAARRGGSGSSWGVRWPSTGHGSCRPRAASTR